MPSSTLQESQLEPSASTSSDDGPKKDSEFFSWTQEIDNYGEKLLKRLDEFRRSSSMYDVRLDAKGTIFNAHKIVLAACGGMFRTCFIDEKTNMMSPQITKIHLNCPPEGVKPILKFAYTGKLEITHKNVFATYLAAEETSMTEVTEICRFIATNKFGWVFDEEKIKEENHEKLIKILSGNETVFKHKTDELSSLTTNTKYALYVRENHPHLYNAFIGICKCLGKTKIIINPTNDEVSTPVKVNENNICEDSKKDNIELNGVDDSTTEKNDDIIPQNGTLAPTTSAIPEDSKSTEEETTENVESNETKPITHPLKALPKPTPPKVTPRKKSQENGDSGEEGKTVIKTPVSMQKSAPKSPPRSPLPRRAIKSESSTIRRKSPTRSSAKSRKAPEPPKVPPPLKSPMKKSPPILAPSPSTKPTRPPAPSKNPPPRPKPPTIKRPTPPTPVETTVSYDNSLNPFADEEPEEDMEKKEESTKDYDDNLNPFA